MGRLEPRGPREPREPRELQVDRVDPLLVNTLASVLANPRLDMLVSNQQNQQIQVMMIVINKYLPHTHLVLF